MVGARRSGPGNLVALVVNAQVLNGIITPMLLTYVLILANRRAVLGDAVNGPVFRAVAAICVAVVGALRRRAAPSDRRGMAVSIRGADTIGRAGK